MIDLHEATVVYRDNPRPALDHVSFHLEPGDWVAVVGDNGSGKTTLLAAIAGLVPLRGGTLTKSADVRAALLLQEADNQFVASTVRHELALSLPVSLDDGARRARVGEAIERFSLRDVLDRNPHRLSGGEKQRLAIATIWLEDPHVLLLDEPLSYLDAGTRAMVVEFVREMNARGAAVVWTTPGGEVAFARRLIYLDDGRVAAGRAAGPAPRERVSTPRARQPAAPSPEQALRLEAVSFAYGDTPVLSGVDLEVARGECFGVCGRNGAGKSTLLLLAGGAFEPTAGRVVRSAAATGKPAHALYLPQSPERLFFSESVRDEIAFGLTRRGLSRAEAGARADDALRAVGLEPDVFAARSPFQISQGEKRRVAFAIAEALAPDLLLLDEPASCLDDAGRAVLDGLIASRTSAGAAVMMASHEPDCLRGACGRVATVVEGRVTDGLGVA